MENRSLLIWGAHSLGVSLDANQVRAFEKFLEELTRWNQEMNLTALHEERPIVVRHFLDSLTLVQCLPERTKLLDIGPGAGFPGIPLKIVRPHWQVVLLEASRKKTYFHKHIIRCLNLSGIRSVWGRSDHEEIKRTLGNRFDVVVSRALSPLHVFLREAVYFTPPGGLIIAMRGRDKSVPDLPESLPLKLDRIVSIDLPIDGITRNLFLFKKLISLG